MKIFRRAAPILGLLSFGIFAAPLVAAPRSINDCEKIQAADAYNRCLASFGPVAHLRGMKGSPGEEGEGDADGGEGGAVASAPPVSHHGHRLSGHRSNGRVYMELDSPPGAVSEHSHRHWTHWHGHRAHHRHH